MFEAETVKESSGEDSDGGDTELDYEDHEGAAVLPDAVEAADQNHLLHTGCSLL